MKKITYIFGGGRLEKIDDQYNFAKDFYYGFHLVKNSKKYDAIVVAVGHEQFKKYTSNDFKALSNGISVIIDVKGIVDNPTWRLWWFF